MSKRVRIGQTAMVMALVASVLVVCPAAAQEPEPSANKAAADALFAEGRALVTQGKFAEACEKFAQSERFEPGVGTSLNLGECHERLGRTASAYAAFGEAKRLAALRGDTEREAFAAQRQTALEPRLSRIVLSLPSGVGGLEVVLDGRELATGALGAPIPVDPGRRTVRVVAPGKRPFEKELTVGQSAVALAVQVVFPGDEPPPVVRPGAWGVMRSSGVVVGAVGIVGGLVGAGFGIAAIAKNSESKEYCLPEDPNQCETLRGIGLRYQAGRYADISTGIFLGGVALVGVGVALFVAGGSVRQDKPPNAPAKASPKADEVQVIPVVAPGVGGVVVRMEF